MCHMFLDSFQGFLADFGNSIHFVFEFRNIL